jgi:hypothetical protein
MWVTNNIIDNMKATIMIVQNKCKVSSIDMVALSLIIGNCQAYALVFTKKSSIPGIITQAASAIIPFILNYLRTHFNI